MSRQLRFAVEVKDLMDLIGESIEQGMSVGRLLIDLDLPPDYLNDPNALVAMEECWRIIVANQNQIHDESHLMSSRPLKRGTTRMIFSNLSHCCNLFEGLETLAEIYNIVHGDNYNFVRKRGNILSFIVDDRKFHYRVTPSPLAIEFALLKIHCALSFLCGRQLKLVRMATRRTQLPLHYHHLNLFDTRLLVGHDYYELAYDAKQAELPFQLIQGVDIAGNIYAHYLSLLQIRQHGLYDDDFVNEVISAMRQTSVGRCGRNQNAVANMLNMSVATLRRKLGSQGTSFRKLLDKVNSELAVNDLHQQMLPADVAEKLGYSDLRSFMRAFKRWYGVSPAVYIKQNRLTQ